MEHLEIELKFYSPAFAALRSRLQDIGAVCISENTFEYNIRYETKDEGLRKGNCLLRLRKDRETTLTYKSPPPAADARFKTYRELEVGVDDFDAMDAILKALGFLPHQVYEKWRETWRLGGTDLCMDTMPFGRFLEIEGRPEPIMELSWQRRILTSYLAMFALLREKERLPFHDVTFDNFKSVDVVFDRYLHLLEAGHEART
jgi:adenylate cyclase class 2